MAGLDENKAIMRRYYEDVSQRADLAAASEIIASDLIDHMPGPVPGRDGHNRTVLMIHHAFPDCRFTVDDLVAEGDRVVGRLTTRATHAGDLMGIPVTGKPVVMEGIDISRIAGSQIVEMWHVEDILAVM